MRCKHNILLFAVLTTGLLIAGCEKKELAPNPEEHEEFVRLAYAADEDVFPEGFYREEDQASTTYYVNTISITPLLDRGNEWIELHTDDEHQARTWVELSRANSSGQTVPQGASQTVKYFEYPALMASGHVIRFRVHKSRYFEPMLDKFNRDKTIGRYNGMMDMASVAELIQYLWVNYIMSMGGHQIGGNRVLEAEGTEDEAKYFYRIRLLSITYGD